MGEQLRVADGRVPTSAAKDEEAAGSIGIVAAVPLTTLVAAALVVPALPPAAHPD